MNMAHIVKPRRKALTDVMKAKQQVIPAKKESIKRLLQYKKHIV